MFSTLALSAEVLQGTVIGLIAALHVAPRTAVPAEPCDTRIALGLHPFGQPLLGLLMPDVSDAAPQLAADSVAGRVPECLAVAVDGFVVAPAEHGQMPAAHVEVGILGKELQRPVEIETDRIGHGRGSSRSP